MNTLNQNKVLFVFLNMIFGGMLTAIAAYIGATKSLGFVTFPEWWVPIIYLGAILVFERHKFVSRNHTLLNVGVFIISGILLLLPLLTIGVWTLQWWYVLGIGLVITLFVDLDRVAD